MCVSFEYKDVYLQEQRAKSENDNEGERESEVGRESKIERESMCERARLIHILYLKYVGRV